MDRLPALAGQESQDGTAIRSAAEEAAHPVGAGIAGAKLNGFRHGVQQLSRESVFAFVNHFRVFQVPIAVEKGHAAFP